jgi:hypothetical protein
LSIKNQPPKATGYKVIEPSSDIVRVVTNVEYSSDAAIADIIDNSIDAGARHVLVRLVGTPAKVDHLLIVDDGKGMTAGEIDRAMSFGRRRKYGTGDLGLYGMGLKSASLSQCPTMSVFSRANRSKPVGLQWTIGKAIEGWKCGVIDDYAADALTGPWTDGLSTSSSGTIVRWDDVKVFRQARSRVDEYVKRFFQSLETYLGMVFHRRLGDGRIVITLDFMNSNTGVIGRSKNVQPLDPFGYPSSGNSSYPSEFMVRHGGKVVRATAHVWPKSKPSNPNYRLIGNIAQRQGLYFYRNDRLIQAGGWNGLRMDGEPHLSLARVAVELPSGADEDFSVRFTKASIEVPSEFIDELEKATDDNGRSFGEFISAAHEVYRSRGKQVIPKIHPVTGIASGAKKIAEKAFGFSSASPFKVHVGRVAKGRLFDLDLDRQQLTVSKSLLDSATSAELKDVIKVMAYLLLEDDLKSERVSVVKRHKIDTWAKMGAAAFKPRDGRAS